VFLDLGHDSEVRVNLAVHHRQAVLLGRVLVVINRIVMSVPVGL